MHILAFALSFWMLMRGLGAGFSYLCFAPWFVLIFCDLSYTIYFESFYTEPACFIFLLATLGAGLLLLKHKQESTPAAVAVLLLFFVCACLLVFVKAQNVVFAPPVAFFGLRAYVPRPEYAGNFQKTSGKNPREQSHRWNIWGVFKKRYFPKSVWFFFAYLMANAALILAGVAKERERQSKGSLGVLFCALADDPDHVGHSIAGRRLQRL